MTLLRRHRKAAAWLAVSAAAFGMGRALRPDDGHALARAEADAVRTGAAAAAEKAETNGLPSPRGSGVAKIHSGDSLPGTGDSHAARRQTGPLSPADIAALGQTFRSATDPLKRREAFLALLSGLTKENAALIRRELGRLDPSDPHFRDFHFAWGRVAGMEAVMSGVTTDEPDMGPSLAGWASTDPAAAAAWFRNLDLNDPAYDALIKGRGIPPEQLRAYLARDLVASLAHSDPAGAFAIATMTGADGRTIPGLVESIARQMIQRDGLEGAALWARNLPGDLGSVSHRRPDGQYEMEDVRAEAMRSIAQTYARSDPRGAAEWALANSNPADDPWVMREVSQEWARQAPADAVSWLEAQADSRGQRESLSAAYAQWAVNDPLSASKHLAGLQSSTERDFAINGFTSVLAREDPASAVIWTAQIANPGLREAATVRAAERYFVQNPAAASQWLPSSGLPPEAQSRLLSGSK